MQLEVEEITPVEKLLKIEVPSEEVKNVVEEITLQVQKKAKLKGFREGKVPLYLVKKFFREEIEQKSIETLIEKTLPKALEEKNLQPLLRPKVESIETFSEDGFFKYNVLVEIRPEIELKREDYIDLEIERNKDEVSEEEVERVLEELRFSFSELKEAEDPIEERFAVVIAFSAFDEEKLIPGHFAENLFIDVGTGEFNSIIEKELIGKKKGDKLTVEVSYPEEALNPLLAGKKVRYEIEIKEVYKRELKELNEDFIKNLNLGVDNLEKLKDSIRKRLLEEKKRRNENSYRERLLEKILQRVDFAVPKRYREIKFYQLVDQLKDSLEKEGLSLEKMNISLDSLRNRLYHLAEKMAKEELLLEKIAELENIAISEEETEKLIRDIQQSLKVPLESAQQIVYYNILPKLLAERVLRFLEENSKPLYKES